MVAQLVATHSPCAATNSWSRIMYTHDTVMHGFAVRVTDEEAARMSRVLGVSGVYKDRAYHTQTTRSPGFLGLHEEFGAWPDSEFGDSGISPESASFDDGGLGPMRPTWKGKCTDAEGFNASLCNNGAKVFTDEPGGAFTPRDKAGHGSHVASMAAGSVVVGANLFEFSRRTARGVAPKAGIAIAARQTYFLNAAVEDAVRRAHGGMLCVRLRHCRGDGVDIVSMSLGTFRNADFYDDIVAVATFGAEHRGVFVVLAGSNQGAEASSVTNVAPWMTPVGAATTDRLFPPTLKLGNGAELGGHLVHHDVPWREHIPLAYSGCDERYMATESLVGKVAVCNYGGDGVKSGIAAQRAGGAGIVDVGFYERFLDGVDGQTFTLPGVTLGYTEFKKLEAYMASVPYPVTSFRFTCDTVTGENRAPTVAGFSSLGPNTVVPEILKPDVIAPGVNILAAWSGDATPTDSEEDPRRVEYNILSGTSMACPHVTGAAALVKKRHGAGPLPWYGRR
ncbi:hypothetical protein ZWY2020_024201 [Hordeum vulgare]|nr:hypothetical protein ZWY2020_024201 [Hordeum vulgare]